MRALLFSIVFLLTAFNLHADLSIEGSYQGKNLYVQNPASEDGFGFCVTKVTVNNNIMPGGVGRSAFEIDFSLFNVKVGKPVFMLFNTVEGVNPKFFIQEVFFQNRPFEVP